MNEEDPGVRHAYQADYIYWLRKDYWGPEEASILLAGYSPEEFPRGDARFETFGSKVDAIHQLVIDDIGSKKIPVRNPPAEWISWSKHVGLTLPVELAAAITRRSELAGDMPSPPTSKAALNTSTTSNDTRTREWSGDRGNVLKKVALIKKHKKQWDTIERDFQDASENGLSSAAKAPVHGHWFEADAKEWARQRGKYNETEEQTATTKATPFDGLIHRIKG